VSQLRQQHNYAHIFAADETSVWLNPAAGKCVAEAGAKEVFPKFCKICPKILINI